MGGGGVFGLLFVLKVGDFLLGGGGGFYLLLIVLSVVGVLVG